MSDRYMLDVNLEFGVTKYKGMGLPLEQGPRCNLQVTADSNMAGIAHVKEGLMVLIDSWKMNITNLSESGDELK